ncbi:unnamed protein product [Calypogeia fissa]
MGSKDGEPHQVLESSSIDELWRMSCSQSVEGGGISKDNLLHNEQESITNSYLSREQPIEGLEQSPINGEGRNVDSYVLAGGSFQIPESASFASIGIGWFLLKSASTKCPKHKVQRLDSAAVSVPFSCANRVYERAVLSGKLANEAAVECRPESAWEPISYVQNMSPGKPHTNELFNLKESACPGASSRSALIPIHLKFEDIRYKILSIARGPKTSWDLRTCWSKKQPQKQPTEKQILNGVSSSVAPGEILAMMGPSGSGKTTMLNILGGRLQKFTGKISYSGLPYTSALKRRIGYVTQDDVLFPILTVRETLVFAALLRLSKRMSHNEKVERAETVLRELGLERCQNTVVGGPFVPGVSGGERKRTSIGYELLVDPSLLLLDEPTSGLDSSTAFRILQLLRMNAQMGRVIVTTIHQPSSRMFPMFDKLILLSEGHPLYSGPAKDAMDYFASLKFVPQLTMNPFDFLLDLASGTTSDITLPPELSTDNTGIKLSSADDQRNHNVSKVGWNTQPESHSSGAMLPSSDLTAEEYQRQMVIRFLRLKYKSNLELQGKEDLHSQEDLTREQIAAMKVKKQWNSSWWEQFIILCRRNCKERRKDYFNILRAGQGLAVAMFLGMLWWRNKLETEQGVRDQVGLLFYIVIFWSSFSMWSTMMAFPMEKNYLAKERVADMYRLSAYFVSSTLCDLLAELIHPTLFIAIVYFMTDLKSDFLTYVLTLLSLYTIVITAQAFGEFFGAATLDVKGVGVVSSMIMLIFLLAGGFYVQKIPIFLRWVRYTSIIYYGFNLLQRVQYSPDQTYNCHEIGGCLRFDESPVFEGRINLDGGMNDALILISMAMIYKFGAYLCLRRV